MAAEDDAELRAPLARFNGQRPPSPAWFERAIGRAPERRFVEVDGAQIELLTWGDQGRPGLLFLHGGAANADWWSFIAPFFAETFRVAAISFSGMGRSDWRERYSVGQFAEEASACARAAGLFEGASKPIVVAHSFGSRPALTLAARPDCGLDGVIILDAPIAAPETPDRPEPTHHPKRVCPSFEAVIARFRLMPPQSCDNPYLLDYIARQSVRSVPVEGGGEGWTWRFDPLIWEKLASGVRVQADAAIRAIPIPLVLIYGERSAIVGQANLAYTRSIAPASMQVIAMPEAGHHLFLDQPIALVSTLRAVLAGMGR